MSSDSPVILVDVMNLVFRQHFVLPNLQHDGKHTGVQYGVLKTIHQLRTNVSSRMIFVWDHGIPIPGAQRPRNWREGLVPNYKGTRKRDPDLHNIVVSQLKELHTVINHLGYSHASVMGLEADDMIGVLAQDYPKVLIFSTDKDFYQLLDKDRVQVLVPRKEKGAFKVINQIDVEKEYGIPISRFAEYLALGGDGCDNIKPMRGMGPKTAIKLIQSGVDVSKCVNMQPEKFLEKYESVWKEICKSYHAARIPTSWSDPRISDCVKGLTPQHISPDQVNVNVKAFETFLANKNMVSLLGVRRSFFESQNLTNKGKSNSWQHTSDPNPGKLSRKELI